MFHVKPFVKTKYEIIVIGGGHAGIEAAWTAAKMNCKTALLTMSKQTLGRPSCNPSIGGAAKGHLVKEIDALGGAMGLLADRAGLHFKMLNSSKGPAVWSPRAQIDKDLYSAYALDYLLRLKNIDIIESSVDEIIIDKYRVAGVLAGGNKISANAVIFCAGTFLNGLMFTGDKIVKGGRFGEPASIGVSDKLKAQGFDVARLKTGTPPRVWKDSVDFSKTLPGYGDEPPLPFSHKTARVKNLLVCHYSDTNEQVHDELRLGFDSSPLFQGVIKGAGPRYCPSIEDKVNRFADRNSHKILLEPEGLKTESIYVNGFSTSLPEEVQEKALRKIPGLENMRIMRYGYAIEYDYFLPYQLKYTMETKEVAGLYFAGQINGTSGYEEAACQGLVAGINAALNIRNEEDFALKRSEAYIGVLIDDLVNKSSDEPYRIFTSQAEYRLLLRQDNAKYRLMKYGAKFGLIEKNEYEKTLREKNKLAQAIEESKNIKLKPERVNPYFEDIGESPIIDSTSLYSLAKRPKAEIEKLLSLAESLPEVFRLSEIFPELNNLLKIEIKYEGYIERQKKEIERFLANENKRIPENIDYFSIKQLSTEAREKLSKVRPESLGQASRISGVSVADISILSVYLKQSFT